MPYINEELGYHGDLAKIQVLEPTEDENGFEEGIKMFIEWDDSGEINLEEFRELIEWMNEQAEYIEKALPKKGKRKNE